MTPLNNLRGVLKGAFLVLMMSFLTTISHSQVQVQKTEHVLDEVKGLYRTGQYSKVVKVGEQWVESSAIQEGVIDAVLISAIARAHLNLGAPLKALPLYARALAIRERVLGIDHPDTAVSMDNLAVTFSEISEYEKALHLHAGALAIFEKVLGPDHLSTARSLNNLAATYSELADFDKALPLEIRALAIFEKTLGPHHPETARAINNLAETYSSLAQFDNSLPLQIRALEIYEKISGADHPDTALLLNNLAYTYAVMAQYEKALLLQIRALTINEKVLGPGHPETARSSNNLASIYDNLNENEKALPLRIRALAIRENTLGSIHPDTALSLSNLASTYIRLGQYENALPLQVRALTIYENSLGQNHPYTALSLNNLSFTYGKLGKYQMALPLQIRALSILENSMSPNHPDTAVSQINLAFLLEMMAMPETSISLLKSAINIYQSQRERISRISADELHAYTDSIASHYQTLARLLVDQGRLAEAQQVLDMLKEDEQFDFIRRSGDSDPRRTRIAYTPTEAQWMTRYRQVASRLAALGAEAQALEKQAKTGLTPEQQARQKALKADMVVAEQAFTAFLGEMQQALKSQGPARAPEVAEVSVAAQRELQGLIQGLGPGAVLLQYYVTDDRVGMILTTPGVVLPFSTVVEAKALNRQIFQFRDLLRNPKSDILPAAQALYQLLLAPVAQALEQAGAKTVMLSLDGNLRHLPFGALHDGKQYMAQRWNLPIYTAVTRDKLRDAVTQRWQAAGLGVTRAIGGFQALPAVKGEMDAMLRTTAGPGVRSVVYLDEQFTAQRLRDVGQRDFQLMHVSSHFSLSPGTEINSFLLLGDGQRLTLGDIRTQNYRFDQLDMLTLSACDTGLGGGRDANGREIEGLGVIAQQQGAKSVLASLWPVADGSTAKLMADLYERRQKLGLSKAEALRQSQLALMAQSRYAHPFYWAPFILLGNWK